MPPEQPPQQPTPDSPERPERSGPSRRALLLGGGAAGLVAAAAGGGFFAGRASAPDTATAAEARTYPFAGAHQAGIVTPAQDRMYLAAFDLTTDSVEDLTALLRAWTTMAARLTQGLSAGPLGFEVIGYVHVQAPADAEVASVPDLTPMIVPTLLVLGARDKAALPSRGAAAQLQFLAAALAAALSRIEGKPR